MKRGLLIVVSGPAGSGKGTVNSQLIATGDFVFSVSATTRAPRPGEVNGVNYHFIDKEEFQRRIDDNGFLEYTTYCDNFYGTPLKEALAVLDSGKNLILEIECDGAKNVKKIFPEAVLIMLILYNPALSTVSTVLRLYYLCGFHISGNTIHDHIYHDFFFFRASFSSFFFFLASIFLNFFGE